MRLTKGALVEACFEAHRGMSAFEAAGCVHCSGTGYRGRTGLYEVLGPTGRVRELILERGSADAIRAAARETGMTTLRQDGLKKVRDGVTSAAEVVRVLGASRA